MFKWLKKLFENPVPEFTPAPQIDPEDQELIDAYDALVKKYRFIEFDGRPSAWDDTITDENLHYKTFINGWLTPEGGAAMQAERSEIIEYWDRILQVQKNNGNDVIVWRIKPKVWHKDDSGPFRVRLRCAFIPKDKVKPGLLPS